MREAVETATEPVLAGFSIKIDETILFHPLSRERRFARSSRSRLDGSSAQLAEHGIRLEVTEAAIDAIAQQGYDPTFGARP